MDSSIASLDNPYAVQALWPLAPWVDGGAVLLMAFALGVPLANLLLRFRRSSGIERQQYKWFVYACVLVTVAGVVAGPSERFALQLLFIVTLFLIPVTVALAILRYQLFDIDLLIRKTLLYGMLSGFLVAIYFSSVVVLQNLFTTITGQNSPIAIVISTLLIAALFVPLGRRIQEWIDRRFYRQKYDAQQVLSRFAQTARSETDLESLSNELLAAVQETVQPEQVDIWIKR